VQRPCDFCGETYEAKTAKSRFCKPDHRVQHHKYTKQGKALPAVAAQQPATPPNTDVADRVMRELEELDLMGRYEAAVVIGVAKQLDSGAVSGTAYVSLSKEVDRRMEVLRLSVVPADDPTKVIQERVAEKQAHLRAV
jgi:hypothetical protein